MGTYKMPCLAFPLFFCTVRACAFYSPLLCLFVFFFLSSPLLALIPLYFSPLIPIASRHTTTQHSQYSSIPPSSEPQLNTQLNQRSVNSRPRSRLGRHMSRRHGSIANSLHARRTGTSQSELRRDALDAVRGVDVLHGGDLPAGRAALARDYGRVGEEVFPDLGDY